MPEARQEKNHFRLNRGLNTESNEISFPDGFTTDEQNYELLVDGSRRRRKALDVESGGAAFTTNITIETNSVVSSYKWRGVGGDPTKNVFVHQIGHALFFSDDAETVSTTFWDGFIPMNAFLLDTTKTNAQLGAEPCQFTHGRGYLFVSHPLCKPFYVEWDTTNTVYDAKNIKILIRDFDGIDDGVSNHIEPTALSDDHKYNLRNRGWVQADIDAYQAGQARYPSKNHLWFRGYRRQTDVIYSDLDGIQVFDHAKMAAEKVGASSAPQGSLFLDPTDTQYSGSGEGGTEIQISTWDFQTGSPTAGGTLRITTASNHGRITTDIVTITGTAAHARTVSLFGLQARFWWDFDGSYAITKVSDTQFDITVGVVHPIWGAWLDQYAQLGQINGNVALPKSDGQSITQGPAAISFHQGRLFYAGIADSEWADTIFFSKIAQRPPSFGICYQENDPTNPELNALSSSDGGTIVIPNLGQVKRMLSTRTSLLVFSDQGVWEVGGGQRGVFTATGYSVRKITEDECSSPFSPLLIGNQALFTGPRGIFVVAPNEFTGLLESQNISDELIRTEWNDIAAADQVNVKTVYDDALKRVYFLHSNSGQTGSTDNVNQYANALILDIRVGAWYKYVFNVSATLAVLNAFSITDSDSSASNKKVKWILQSTNNINIGDLDQTDYVDFDGAESPLPYMVTGWDDLGDFQRRRQAPVITVFAKRTETGYTSTGNGWDPDNESSNLMTAYWDWTDDSVSGKIGSQNETYRHVRGFVPSAADDVDGYPVVVTRNKVRGRGRVLQLRFDGAATKDSHILGFSTNYKRQRSV